MHNSLSSLWFKGPMRSLTIPWFFLLDSHVVPPHVSTLQLCYTTLTTLYYTTPLSPHVASHQFFYSFMHYPNGLFFFLFFPIMIFQNVKDINKNNKKWNEWNYSICFPKINSYNYTNYCPKNRPTNRKIRIFI